MLQRRVLGEASEQLIFHLSVAPAVQRGWRAIHELTGAVAGCTGGVVVQIFGVHFSLVLHVGSGCLNGHGFVMCMSHRCHA